MAELKSPLIDHVVIMVADLAAAQAAFSGLGFVVSDRGYHATFATSNHLIVFDACYVELLGVDEPCDANRQFQDRIEQNRGLDGLALPTFDVALTRRFARSLQIPLTPPLSFDRPVRGPNGPDTARFRTSFLEPVTLDRPLMFYCEHGTPQLIWSEAGMAHPNGADAVVNARFLCGQVEKLAAALQMLSGAQASRGGAGMRISNGMQSILLDPTRRPRLTLRVKRLPTVNTIESAGFRTLLNSPDTVLLSHECLGLTDLELVA